jgi:hypothetical protein
MRRRQNAQNKPNLVRADFGLRHCQQKSYGILSGSMVLQNKPNLGAEAPDCGLGIADCGLEDVGRGRRPEAKCAEQTQFVAEGQNCGLGIADCGL